MKRTELIKALANNGIEVEAIDTVKNGVVLEGLTKKNHGILNPVVYVKAVEDLSFEDAVAEVIRIFAEAEQKDISMNWLDNAHTFKQGLRTALQKESTENIVKRVCAFPNVEEYMMYSNDSECFTVKVNRSLLDKLGIDISEAWSVAEENTNADVSICNLAEKIFGFVEKSMPYIVTNNSCTKGASAILTKSARAQLKTILECESVVVLPSSIHEVLVMPCTSDTDIEMLNSMVDNVNTEVVDDVDVLASQAFVMVL